MGTNRGRFFRRVTFQLVALVAALSGVRAQSSTAIGAHATGRNGGAFVSGSLQPSGLMTTSHGSAQPASGFFVTPSGQSTAVLNTGSAGPAVTFSAGSNPAGSPSFAYTAPGDTFTIFMPNESAFTANDLFPPLQDMLRTGFPGDPRGRLIPGAGGSALDISAANHFEASVAPRWVLRRQSRYPVTVALPAQITVGDDPYYFGHHFGWIAAGVNVRVPLSFIPRQYGKWSATTSADLCYYGTTPAEFENSIGLQMPKLGAALTLDL